MIGRVAGLWRYPVKSMQGESLNASAVDEGGLLGDRAYALQDVETGKVVSAKSPRLWPNLLNFHAAFVEPPAPGRPLPPVHITFPDGSGVRTDEPHAEEALSDATGRKVRLITSTPPGGSYEWYVPDVDGVDPFGGRDVWADVPNDLFGTGRLHDAAPVHLLTTATLDRLTELYPDGRFETRRFRPNVVVDLDDGAAGFVENDWMRKDVRVGDVEVRVTFPMSRCVMTTLAQGDLPADVGILRTIAKHNRVDVLSLGKLACVGVGGLVRGSGTIRRGDRVTVAES